MSYQEEMKRMIDELQEKTYNKAVDDFAEAICDKIADDSIQVMLPDGFRADVVTIDYVAEIAVEIAGRLKQMGV
jgi:hypothetical protein